MLSLLFIIIFIIFVAIILSVGVYVGMIKKNRIIKNSWQNIIAQSGRRRDLIPFLINVVKQYNEEDDIALVMLEELSEKSKNISNIEEKAQIESEITLIIREIFDSYRNFPDLINNSDYIRLEKTFEETERQMQVAKSYYNENILEFNEMLTTFPTNIIGEKLNMALKEPFNYQGEFEEYNEEYELDEEDTLDENANEAVYENSERE